MKSGLIIRVAAHGGAAVGLVFLTLIVSIAVFAPMFIQISPWALVGQPLIQPFEDGFVLGTDMIGRDVAVQLIHGARFSLLIGLLSTMVSVGIGMTIGAVAGFFRGWVDEGLMRVTEFFQIIPGLVLIMVLVAVMGTSMWSVVVGIGVVSWPAVARIMRAEVLSLRTRQFVDAARASGQRPGTILLVQVIPNAMSAVIVVASVMVAQAILIESGLSFLGLGDPNVVTWGYMIGAARPYLREAWWLSAMPGFAILLTVLAINLVGDGLTTALNPRRARNRGAS